MISVDSNMATPAAHTDQSVAEFTLQTLVYAGAAVCSCSSGGASCQQLWRGSNARGTWQAGSLVLGSSRYGTCERRQMAGGVQAGFRQSREGGTNSSASHCTNCSWSAMSSHMHHHHTHIHTHMQNHPAPSNTIPSCPPPHAPGTCPTSQTAPGAWGCRARSCGTGAVPPARTAARAPLCKTATPRTPCSHAASKRAGRRLVGRCWAAAHGASTARLAATGCAALGARLTSTPAASRAACWPCTRCP